MPFRMRAPVLLPVLCAALVPFAAACGSDPERGGFGSDECTRLGFGFDFRADVEGDDGVVMGEVACASLVGCDPRIVPPGMEVQLTLDLRQHDPASLDIEADGAEATFALTEDACEAGPIAQGTVRFDRLGEAVLRIAVDGREIDRFTWHVREMAGLVVVDGDDQERTGTVELAPGQELALLAWPTDADGARIGIPPRARWQLDDATVAILRSGPASALVEGEEVSTALVLLRGEAPGETRLVMGFDDVEVELQVRVAEARE